MNEHTANWIKSIDDEELDPRRLIAAIRRDSPHKEIAYEVQGLHYPVHPTHRYPGKPDDIPYDQALHQFVLTARAVENGSARGRLSAYFSRLPLVGPVWDRFHRVVSRLLLPFLGQRSMNHNLLGAIERLVAENQMQARQIVALKAELDTLRPRRE
jgi:hypothetical protein